MPLNNKGENNPMYGKKHTDETKFKMSQIASLRKLEKSPSWKGGKRINHNGYVEILIRDHHRSRKNGYVFEHILVAEKNIGRELNENERVHHVNEDKQDNRPENLQIVSPAEHVRMHAPMRRKGKNVNCIICEKQVYRKPSHLKTTNCCSTSCAAKYGNQKRKGVV